MSSESIPVGLRSLLSKHYFLAQITTGQKPCMSNMTIVEASSWAGKFQRAWNNENRKTNMTDIENIISQTIDCINTHKKNPAFLRLIINALADTRVGIESMITTYRNDQAMIGRLQVQLTNIDLQLEKHRHLIKGYKDKTCKEKEQDDENINKNIQNSKEFLTDPHSPHDNTNNNNIVDRNEQERIDRHRRRRKIKPGDISINELQDQ